MRIRTETGGRSLSMERFRAVLADDDPVFRDLLATFMRRDGRFEVVGKASDGIEAVSLTLDRQPDVVILDLNMPKLHGAEALTRIRESCADVRIVVVSAVLGDHATEVLLEQGADACLSKATPARSIVSGVAEVLAG